MERNRETQDEMKDRRRGWKILRLIGLGIGGVCLAGLLALVLSIVVQWLWNWLMPDIFGLKQITYWQALGLIILGRLLFGGLRHHHPPPHSDRFRRSFRHNHSHQWREYRHFWREKGRAASDDLIDRVDRETSRQDGET